KKRLPVSRAAGGPRLPRSDGAQPHLQPLREPGRGFGQRPQQLRRPHAVGHHREDVVSGYQAVYAPLGGQMQVSFLPRTPRVGHRAVLLAHADDAATETTGGCLQWNDPINYPGSSALAAQLAGSGLSCVGGDCGGTETFGASPAAADAYASWQSMVADHGAAPDKVVIVATSMGFCTAYQMARANPGKVAAI